MKKNYDPARLADLDYALDPDASDITEPPKKSKSKTLAASGDLLSPDGQTDLANARRLVAQHGNDLRWCEPWGKWLAWDGKRWGQDAERRVDGMSNEVADDIWKQVFALLPDLDGKDANKLTSFAKATSSDKGIVAMQSRARSVPGIPILPDRLDADRWALNCANGTVDLRTAGPGRQASP